MNTFREWADKKKGNLHVFFEPAKKGGGFTTVRAFLGIREVGSLVFYYPYDLGSDSDRLPESPRL